MTERKIPYGYNQSWEHPIQSIQLVDESRTDGPSAMERQQNSIYQNQSSLEDHLAGIQSPGAVVGGVVLIGTYSVSAATHLLIDNVFSKSYDNYRIVGKLSGTINANNLFFQFIDSSGGTIGGANSYISTPYGLDFQTAGTTFNTLTDNTVAYVGWLPNSSAIYCAFSIDMFGPNIAADQTTWHISHTSLSTTAGYRGGFTHGVRSAATLERGVRFDDGGGGNLTGKVSVFGYRM